MITYELFQAGALPLMIAVTSLCVIAKGIWELVKINRELESGQFD